MGQQARKLRVLLVEDHDDTATSTATLLRLFGHDVAVAGDGPTALHAAPVFQPDVVLLDIGLPRMDGFEVARQLPAVCGPKPPVLIALTGYGGEEERRRCAEAGIYVYFLKPVDPLLLELFLAQLKRRLVE